jgi:hypothetical protein
VTLGVAAASGLLPVTPRRREGEDAADAAPDALAGRLVQRGEDAADLGALLAFLFQGIGVPAVGVLVEVARRPPGREVRADDRAGARSDDDVCGGDVRAHFIERFHDAGVITEADEAASPEDESKTHARTLAPSCLP